MFEPVLFFYVKFNRIQSSLSADNSAELRFVKSTKVTNVKVGEFSTSTELPRRKKSKE